MSDEHDEVSGAEVPSAVIPLLGATLLIAIGCAYSRYESIVLAGLGLVNVVLGSGIVAMVVTLQTTARRVLNRQFPGVPSEQPGAVEGEFNRSWRHGERRPVRRLTSGGCVGGWC